MAVVPKRLTFQLRFRNKTKTRKILSRDFRLRVLLKKDSNHSNRFCYSYTPRTFGRIPGSRQEQKGVLKNPLITTYLGIQNQKTEDTRATITKVDLKKCLKKHLLYFKKDLFETKKVRLPVQGLWFTRQAYPFIKIKKTECLPATVAFLPSLLAKRQPFLNLSWLSNRKRFCSNIFTPNCVFLKKKETVALKKNKLLFGRYGLCFKQYSIISSTSVETAKLDIAKILRKKGRFWIRICCDTPVSARPAETRMGKGKGSISYWAAKVNSGQLFFEFSGVGIVQLKEIYQKLCTKSAVCLKMIY